jgi:hypothetical protein
MEALSDYPAGELLRGFRKYILQGSVGDVECVHPSCEDSQDREIALRHDLPRRLEDGFTEESCGEPEATQTQCQPYA